MAIDHLNDIERALIDNLRLGQYNTVTAPDTAATGNAWTSADVTVYGQFPTTVETKYPCIITEMAANGIETQFMGQRLTSGSSNAVGELYGAVDSKAFITVDAVRYKERRLLNYLMLNCANVLMDVDFPVATVPATVVERHFSGFRDIGYNPDLETWNAISSMVIVFKNSR
jgi:hypothetical protein